MTEKKPIKPLLLFFTIAVLSFSVGVFVGVVVKDSWTQTAPAVESNHSEILSEAEPFTKDKAPEENTEKENKTLSRYKEMLKKSIESSSQSTEFFKNYGIVVDSYTNIDQANNVAIDLKSQYNWKIAVYPMENNYKVIIGPFDSKDSAQQFLRQIPKIPRFTDAKVIQFPVIE